MIQLNKMKYHQKPYHQRQKHRNNSNIRNTEITQTKKKIQLFFYHRNLIFLMNFARIYLYTHYFRRLSQNLIV